MARSASDSTTAHGYEQARARVAALLALDSPAIAPECRTLLLAHGTATDTAVLFFHGMTNCPAQFERLARVCHERGANVLVPRLPRHGLSDKTTDALAGSDARELADFTDRAIDAASGLGRRLVVAGLSIGGTLAGWAGQTRHEVAHAVVIAPLLGLPRLPAWTSGPIGAALAALPNAFLWWDRRRRTALAGPTHVYPRFATRAVAASIVLGARVLALASSAPPACRSAAVITIDGDPAVGNGAADALARRWRAHGRAVVEHRFDRHLGLNHDLIDPDQVGARTDVSYPVLLRLLDPPVDAGVAGSRLSDEAPIP